MAAELEKAPASAPAAPTPAAKRKLEIKGRRKAAVLLVALGPDRAAEVFKHLRDEEIETLSLEMAGLHRVDHRVTEAVFEELALTVEAYDSLLSGGVDYAREVLERALGPERALEIIGRLSSVIEMRPFEFLRRTPAEQLVTFLRNESPQTVALVVANLHTTLASQVLANLPGTEQAEIAVRIARMSETSPDVVKQVESVMKKKLDSVVQQEYVRAAGGIKSLAEILNHTDRSTERNVLDSLTEADEELAAEVRRLLFVFEDIVKLDDRSIQLVLREADQKDLALALRGVNDDVKERILSNMSERGATMLVEEMAYQPPQRKRVVEEAQGRIVAIVRKLEEAGALVLSRGEEDAVV
ncbi:MAG TPA: flagellar motor switch protein FliG [Solirubrobacteraceae bacterium]|jgi:flagellar motor switch protein FliG|nr:flagellar motor switch protein FliG [Solirubrobacteraceae bacterium]